MHNICVICTIRLNRKLQSTMKNINMLQMSIKDCVNLPLRMRYCLKFTPKGSLQELCKSSMHDAQHLTESSEGLVIMHTTGYSTWAWHWPVFHVEDITPYHPPIEYPTGNQLLDHLLHLQSATASNSTTHFTIWTSGKGDWRYFTGQDRFDGCI